MVQKYLLAFVFGGIVAGGVIYFALAHRSAPSPAPAASQIESTQPQAAPVTPPGAAAQTPEAAPEPASVTPTPVRTTRRAKPEPSQPEAAEAVSSEPQSEQPAQVAQAPAQPEVPPQTAPAVQLQTRPPAPSEPKPQAQPSKIMRPEPVIENRDRTPQTVTIPAGTALAVRLREVISTDKQSKGDSFTATL
ncbi:MAG: hypothetical protein ABSC08_18655, partial [Bryobacteraceae bacterium]